MDRPIGFELKTINNLIRRRLDSNFVKAGVDDACGIRGPILGFIADNSKNGPVFQKDIEKAFNIRRSTATVTLQGMENNGYIVREPVKGDGRLKKIVLTDKAVEMDNRIHNLIDSFHEELERGITPEEKEFFLKIIDKIKENLTMEIEGGKNA